jgi:hypothetical protein
MRLLILLALIAAGPAHAATLRCLTAENCINDQCKPVTDPDSAFLLINPDGPAPIFRSKGNDTTMTKRAGDAPMKWQGTQSLADDQIRISITLAIDPANLTYALSQLGEFGTGVSTGQCEVR